MSENNIFMVPVDLAETAWVSNDKYLEMYKQSIEDNEGFWGKEGKRLDWIKPYNLVKEVDYNAPDVSIKW